ncbi:probable glutamate receptor [Penaeus vannamei]|uniref:probable glutamate receptor n=1 Tax=Penaeus vannamei TaxID=6689 RepID=UPI00387F4C6B
MRKPSNDDHIWSVYTKQFSVPAWGTIFGTVLALIVLLHLSTRLSPQQPSFTFLDSATVIIGFIFGQGTSQPLISASCRLVILMGLMLQVLLLAYYTSDLVSSLTAGPSPPKLSTLYDVYKNPSLKLGFEKGAAPHLYFSESNDNIVKKLWQRIQDNNYETLMNSLDEGMQRVLKEPYLHMGWGIPMRYGYGHDCRLFMLPTSYFHVQASFMMKKDSPLVPVLNKVVMDIMSTGLLRKWWRDWSTEAKNCDLLQNAPVGMKAVFGPFFMLAVALASSVLVFVGEVLRSRGQGGGKGVMFGRF